MTLAQLKLVSEAALGTAVLLLSGAYVVAGQWWGVGLVLLLGGVWAAWLWRGEERWPWAESLLLILLALSTIGPLLPREQPFFFSYGGILATIIAWDLRRFWRHLDHHPHGTRPQTLIAIHLRRLGAVVLLALLGLALTRLLSLPFNFGWSLALGLILIFGLRFLVQQMRRESG